MRPRFIQRYPDLSELGFLFPPSATYWIGGISHLKLIALPLIISNSVAKVDLINLCGFLVLQCIVQTWYLTVDMVMFYLSPLIVYPLWKWPTFGYINFILFYLASIASSFYVAWKRQFIGGMPLTYIPYIIFDCVTNYLYFSATLLKTEYFQNHYITPHTRGTTYILGLGFGYILHLTKNERVFMSKPTVVIGWFLCSVMLIVPVVGSHVFQDEAHPYNRFESSIFLSCSRSAWCFGVGWLIWACVNGYGGLFKF